jgi:hypothetical protein
MAASSNKIIPHIFDEFGESSGLNLDLVFRHSGSFQFLGTGRCIKNSSSSQVQGSGLGKRLKLDPRNTPEKCRFCHIIARCHVPDPPASPIIYGKGIP